MKLILVRHAKSSWKHSGLDDMERPLNKRGKRDAPAMGELLRKKGVMPDCVISSPARRAAKTAKHIARQVNYPPERIVLDEAVYMASAEELFDIIHRLGKTCETVMIVGHNPAFTGLVKCLSDFRVDNMPTCGMAAFAFDVEDWSGIEAGSGKLLFFEYPKKNRAQLAGNAGQGKA